MGVLLLGLATCPLPDDADDCHRADDEILPDWGGGGGYHCGVRAECAIQAGLGWLLDVRGRVGGVLPSKDQQFVPRMGCIDHAAVPHTVSISR